MSAVISTVRRLLLSAAVPWGKCQQSYLPIHYSLITLPFDVTQSDSNCNINPLSLKVSIIQGGAKRTHVFESACDFFLWDYLKSEVYVRKPRTADDLKVSIREEIATVPQEMLVNVTQNFEERLRTCVRQEGRHLPPGDNPIAVNKYYYYYYLSDIIFRN